MEILFLLLQHQQMVALHVQNPEMHHLRSAKMVNVCHAEHARLQLANLLELRHIFMP